MKKSNLINIESPLFDYERLIDGNEYSIKRFESVHGATGLTEYLKKQALKDEQDLYVRNYVVKIKNTEAVIAFFTLKAGAIPYSESAQSLTFTKETKLVPGIELVNIALNDYYISRIKKMPVKCGKYIFNEIIEKMILEISNVIGVKVIYLFAANQKLADYYETWGFYKNADKRFNDTLNQQWQNEYSKDCVFMYKPVAEI